MPSPPPPLERAAERLQDARAPAPAGGTAFELARSRRQYHADIAACQEALHSGDSYEICLTNALLGSAAGVAPWRFYQVLRRVNPAPYAAWMHCGKVRELCRVAFVPRL